MASLVIQTSEMFVCQPDDHPFDMSQESSEDSGFQR